MKNYQKWAGLDDRFTTKRIGWATLVQGECLEAMREIPDASIDMVLCDLPYGTTQNKWDSVIPFENLWAEYRRVCKGMVVLTTSQPFTSQVVMSAPDLFKYAWVWEKSAATGHLNAKRMPMKLHEDVLVFCLGEHTYNPQDLVPHNKVTSRRSNGGNFGDSGKESFQEWTNYPRSIVRFPRDAKPFHPTQKPVALMEYLIRTYTNEGDVVLDNTMGSGTTGVACLNTGRRFIGIEREQTYFEVACQRVSEANTL